METTAVPFRSPVAQDTDPSTNNTRMNGFLKLLSSITGQAVARSWATVLRPYFCSRSWTSASVSPSGTASRASNSDRAGALEASSSAEEAPLPRGLGDLEKAWATALRATVTKVASGFMAGPGPMSGRSAAGAACPALRRVVVFQTPVRRQTAVAMPPPQAELELRRRQRLPGGGP
jgi:hypothetical protein